MNLALLGRGAEMIKVHFYRGWERFSVRKILTAQKHLPELILYGRTDGPLPVCWEIKTSNGATHYIWFGKVIAL